MDTGSHLPPNCILCTSHDQLHTTSGGMARAEAILGVHMKEALNFVYSKGTAQHASWPTPCYAHPCTPLLGPLWMGR